MELNTIERIAYPGRAVFNISNSNEKNIFFKTGRKRESKSASFTIKDHIKLYQQNYETKKLYFNVLFHLLNAFSNKT